LTTGTPLREWKAVDCPAVGDMQLDAAPDGKPAFHSHGGPLATWRTSVRLARGHYRFQGLVWAQDVTPLPFGKNHGARLRTASLGRPTAALTGTCGWTELGAEFAVPEPEAEVELICELRASRGEAWFAQDSLLVKRID
jgi:hypothetical protein